MFFEGMTDSEKATLSDEQVNRRIERECAEQGIPLWVDEPPQPEVPVAHDATYYRIGQWVYRTEAEAVAVQRAACAGRRWMQAACAGRRWMQAYTWRSDAQGQWMPDESELRIEAIAGYTPETWQKHQGQIEAFARRKAEYEKVLDANRKAYEARAAVSGNVWSEVHAAREAIRETDRLRKLYERYVGLADGNREVALRFLRTAEKLDASWIPTWEAGHVLAENFA